MTDEPKNALSASKIKTLQSCSWLYWCKYHLKLPDRGNDGSSRGTICHLIFELLGKKSRKNLYNLIIKKKDIFSVPSVKRLVLKHAKKLNVDDADNIQLIKDMTLNGLMYDFYGNNICKPTKEFSELSFEIKRHDNEYSYKIRGFIDKLFLYKKSMFALIRDFKSSKEVFKGKDLEDNLQDLTYSLAVKNLFPEYRNRQSEFLFLKFDLDQSKQNTFKTTQLLNGKKLLNNCWNSEVESGIVRMCPLTQEELIGFEQQLTELQKIIDNFEETDAVSNFARRQGFPTDGSFSGALQCGFAKTKGELRNDGNPKWACPMKWDFFYYQIFDKSGNLISSIFEEDFNESLVPKDGYYELKYYSGCPAFK